MADIDLYEFQETLMKVSVDWQNYIEIAYEKTIGYVLVGNPHNPPQLEKRLKSMGFTDGESVFVVLQD